MDSKTGLHALEPEEFRASLKKAWTQAERARRVGIQQPNIARLEGGSYDRVSLPTLKKSPAPSAPRSRSNSPHEGPRAAIGQDIFLTPTSSTNTTVKIDPNVTSDPEDERLFRYPGTTPRTNIFSENHKSVRPNRGYTEEILGIFSWAWNGP